MNIDDKIGKEILLPHLNINKLSEIERTVIARRSLLFILVHIIKLKDYKREERILTSAAKATTLLAFG